MSVILALLGFHLLVVTHELGHFLVARWTGMRVLRFSIGFGPALVRVERGGTIYSFGLLPLGGLVQVAGLNTRPRDVGEAPAKDAPSEDDPSSYHNKPWWQRVAMVSAGPAFNVGFSALLFLGLFLTFNTLRSDGATHATTFLAAVDGPAAAAGLMPGDVIVRVDGTDTPDFHTVVQQVGAAEGRPVTLGIRRAPPGAETHHKVEAWDPEKAPGLLFTYPQYGDDWAALDITVTPLDTARGFRLGVTPALFHFGAANPWDAMRYAARETWAINRSLGEAVARMFRGEEKPQVTSIVKLTALGADRIKLGIADWYLDLLALISVNLALFNLLPLPALDGGRLLFLAIEAVARRPVPRRFEAWVHAFGFAMLIGLVLFVMGQELWERLGS